MYLGYCSRMVFGTRYFVRGHGRGRGQGHGRAISVHELVHGGSTQEENREAHVSEQQEESQREDHAESEEVDLRQMMRTILDRLPLVLEQDRAHQENHAHRPRSRSRSPWKDHHRLIVSSQMKDLSRICG